MAKDESTGAGATPPIKVVADAAIEPGTALLIALPLVIRGCSPELLRFMDVDYVSVGRQGDIVVDHEAGAISFTNMHDAAMALAVAEAPGLIAQDEGRAMIERAATELAKRGRAVKLTNLGGNDGHEEGQR